MLIYYLNALGTKLQSMLQHRWDTMTGKKATHHRAGKTVFASETTENKDSTRWIMDSPITGHYPQSRL